MKGNNDGCSITGHLDQCNFKSLIWNLCERTEKLAPDSLRAHAACLQSNQSMTAFDLLRNSRELKALTKKTFNHILAAAGGPINSCKRL